MYEENNKHGSILFNTMYSGSYTEENIGHEIINLFKANKGKNGEKHYIYVSPNGKIGNENKVKYIILGNYIKGCFEILYMAKVKEICYNKNKINLIHQEQAKYKYSEKCLYNIFKDNDYNSADETIYALLLF